MAANRREASLPVGWVQRAGKEALLRLPMTSLRRHLLVTGTTGWGKSGFLLSLLLGLINRNHRVNLCVVDPKGETVAELRDRFLPALRAIDKGVDPTHIVHLRLFGSRYVLPLNPLVPIEGLAPQVQANLVCGSFELLVGHGGFGPRMKGVMAWLCRAVIDLRGSLLDVLTLLSDPDAADRAAAQVRDAEVRHYLLQIYDQEPASTRHALRSRLEWVLLVPEVRRALCSPGSLSGADLLQSPMTLVDLSGSPQGFVGLSRFVGSLVLQRIVGAVFSRTVGPKTPPVVLCMDEWQELVRVSHEDIERLLALARFKKVGLWLANQSTAQISGVSPALLRSLTVNIATHVAFRPDPADIKHLLPLLPVTGRCVDPARPDRLLTPAEERARLMDTLARLPPRHALLGDLVAGRAEVIRTLSVPYDEARRRAARLTEAERQLFWKGRLGVPVETLTSVRALGEPAASREAPQEASEEEAAVEREEAAASTSADGTPPHHTKSPRRTRTTRRRRRRNDQDLELP